MDIKITGLADVQRRLKEMPSLVVAKAFHAALDRAAGVMAAEVEIRAPLGEEGLLPESIITPVEVDVQKRGGQAAVGFSSAQDPRTGVPEDVKAAWVEYGHRQVTHRPGHEQVGYVLPHPFMRPAFDSSANKAIEVFAQALAENLSDQS
jgi:HK97 gp10 family phage protein